MLQVAEIGGRYQTHIRQRWVEVLVDLPPELVFATKDGQQKLFLYRIPSDLHVKPGDILSVPFGTQVLGGIAIRLVNTPPSDIAPSKIKEVEDIVHQNFFQESYWKLMERVSQYYYTPLIQVIRAALPPGLLVKSQRRVRLTVAGVAVNTKKNPVDDIQLLPLFQKSKTFQIRRFVSKPYIALLSLYLQNIIENELLIFTLCLLLFRSSVYSVHGETANRILQILQEQKDGDYSLVFLQKQIKGASRAVSELAKLGLVEKYIETSSSARPKLQKAVILTAYAIAGDITNRQREILEVLRRRGGEMWLSELLQVSGAASSTLKLLSDKGYIVIEEREVLRSDSDSAGVTLTGCTEELAKTLTPAQAQALKTIRENQNATILLHGVTGSGKTEVYLQAIAPLLEEGKSALVLVPEIGLTPQLTDRFRARFGSKVHVYHSGLSSGERYDTWRQMLNKEPQVVIGTRSAIFAPLSNLGLIILDEEHDSSFKQDSPIPTYHARTIAQWRAELENCVLVLGSATPALETLIASQFGNTLYLSLPERVNSRPLPPVEIVDMRSELQQGNKSMFSYALQQALLELQDRKQQGILFIHRRGHSTFVSCRSCGYVMECPQCDVSLSYHQTEAGAPQLLRCHYCNYVTPHSRSCPECGSPYFKFFGSGTQKVAQELAREFPELRVIRFDSDTTTNKGAHRYLLTQFINGEADILLGTQMLTKGLDLPQVTLVGIVAADGLLHLSDYRASERAFQTLTQVAGRAGRGEEPGRVILQTYTPEHPVIQAVREHDYKAFTDIELEQRQALNYPPFGRLILLRLSSVDAIQVANAAEIIAAFLRSGEGYEILGPAPASIMRVANRYRWQIMLKFSTDALPQLPNWDQIREMCPDSVSLTIDVDPLNIM
ncbi:MAG: primosomal protein N' [Calothrix sp. C42_A2020_038]|nr:primosomal protein N' [Calothrix sp. C42_A2020_038]